MKNNELKKYENIRLNFERINDDKKHLLVNISWKADMKLEKTEDIEVYVEVGRNQKQSIKLRRLKDSDVWHTSIKIPNTLDEVYYFDKQLTVKLVRSMVIPYNPNYSYAF